MKNNKYKVGDKIEYIGENNYVERAHIIDFPNNELDRVRVRTIIDKVLYISKDRILGRVRRVPLVDNGLVLCSIFISIVFLFVFAMSSLANSEPIKVPPYEQCINQIGRLYDNINDTVGATYAIGDTPTSNIEKLLAQCIELNK